ncbi:M20/M25/M40 family metallo-hydrolase [Nonomuraea sp. NPDC002799]
MDKVKLSESIYLTWQESILPSLARLIEIPALSPAFDVDWEKTGHLRAAVVHVQDWILSRALPGARCQVIEFPGLSPLLLVEVPATSKVARQPAVLLYGHLDRQPPAGEWSDGLDPWQAVFRNGKLFGRGVVDDSYSGYVAIAALEAIRAEGGEHARTVILLETGEESGSSDLPLYMTHLGDVIGDISLVVCLDSGGGDYERLWVTNSLRGLIRATVTVRVLDQPQHSGMAGGIVPSSFQVMRQLLDRVEDPNTGVVKLREMSVEISEQRRAEAAEVAELLPGRVKTLYPTVEGMRLAAQNEAELILNNTWRPTLSVVGAAGMPDPAMAGNVLRASTTLVLSFRTPPTVDARAALKALTLLLNTNVPYGAHVEITDASAQSGWIAPAMAPWLTQALSKVQDRVFRKRHQSVGLGASVPSMKILGRAYPQAQFLVTGALGSDSNAHAPDEWLNVLYAQKITASVAYVLDAHARHRGSVGCGTQGIHP